MAYEKKFFPLNSSGCMWIIPQSNNDSTLHTLSWGNQNQAVFTISWEGDSVGGIQNQTTSVDGNFNVSNDVNITGFLTVTNGIEIGTGGIDCAGPIIAGLGFSTVGSAFSVDETGALVTSSVDTVNDVNVGKNLSLGGTPGTNANHVLALSNSATAPSDSVDTVQLYGVDISAGNASLGIKAEASVTTETVITDRTFPIKINGTTYKLCLKI